MSQISDSLSYTICKCGPTGHYGICGLGLGCRSRVGRSDQVADVNGRVCRWQGGCVVAFHGAGSAAEL